MRMTSVSASCTAAEMAATWCVTKSCGKATVAAPSDVVAITWIRPTAAAVGAEVRAVLVPGVDPW